MARKLYKVGNQKENDKKEWTDLLGNCYLIYLLGFLPLIMQDGFFDITRTKYIFFAYGTLVFGLLMGVAVLASRQNLLGFFKTADIKVYVTFLLVSVVSALLSVNTMEAFTGSNGRYRGVLEFLLYLLVFFILYYTEEWYSTTLYLAGSAALLVFLLGICNSFYYDPLHTFEEIHSWDLEKFTSTIGQIDIYGEYCGIVLAVLLGLCFLKRKASVMEKVGWSLLFFTGSFALFCNNSDTGFFAIVVAFFMAFLFLKDKDELIRICYALCLFGAAPLIKNVCFGKFRMKAVSGLCGILNQYSYCSIGLILIAIALILLCCRFAMKPLKKYIIGFFIILGTVGVSYVILANFNRSLPIPSELIWGPEWGSKRGLLWMSSLDLYSKLNFKEKLLGVGADTLGYYYDAYAIQSGFHYDSAHNCILQLLLGVGICGVITWLAFLGRILYKAVKNYGKDARILAAFIGLFAYFVMSMIGIQICYTEVYAVIAAGLILRS